MVGITLSREQIRAAPPEVRRWLEREIATSLGLLAAAEPAPAAQAEPRYLVGCGTEETEAIFALIQGLPPVVGVFFELGRETGRALPNGLRVFGLLDMQSHAQLQRPAQVLKCLEVINRAMRQVRGDADATLYGLDDRANCFIAETTHRSIRELWHRMIAGQASDAVPEDADPAAPHQPAAVLQAAPGDR